MYLNVVETIDLPTHLLPPGTLIVADEVTAGQLSARVSRLTDAAARKRIADGETPLEVNVDQVLDHGAADTKGPDGANGLFVEARETIDLPTHLLPKGSLITTSEATARVLRGRVKSVSHVNAIKRIRGGEKPALVLLDRPIAEMDE